MKRPIYLLALWAMFTACTKDKTPEPVLTLCESQDVTYTNYVKPLIDLNCSTAGCHVPNAGVPGDYTTYAGLRAHIDNGKFVFRCITIRDMPPIGPLSEEDVAKLNCWIEQGAPQN